MSHIKLLYLVLAFLCLYQRIIRVPRFQSLEARAVSREDFRVWSLEPSPGNISQSHIGQIVANKANKQTETKPLLLFEKLKKLHNTITDLLILKNSGV